MRIELATVELFQSEDNLQGWEALLEVLVFLELRCVLEQVHAHVERLFATLLLLLCHLPHFDGLIH